MRHWNVISLVAPISVIAAIAAGLVAEDSAMPFQFKTKRDSDKVTAKIEKENAIFSIASPFGISQVLIERKQAKWPDSVSLSLQLAGLESFQVSNGTSTLHASVSFQAKNPQIRQWIDDKEDSPMDSASPHWMDIRLINSEGKPATEFPLKSGQFLIALPKTLFDDNPKSITVNWIDFHRS